MQQATDLRDHASETGVAGSYDHAAVEARWQETWREGGTHATPPPDDREPVSVFADCPVAAGGASLGHVRGLAIADAYARTSRARGRAVLFSLGFDCFDPLVELEAARRGVAPAELAQECCALMRGQFERLGYSLDWDRAFLSSEPDHCRWSQRLFSELLERDLIYPRDGRWLLRTSTYAEQNETSLDDLPDWSAHAVRSQRDVLGRVDGIEIDAVVVGGGNLPVFTAHADAVESAAFVAVSPDHAGVDAFTALPDVAERLEEASRAGWWADASDGKRVPAVSTGLQASVPGASTLLPIVISPSFDDCLREAGVLGIPERDERARAIAKTLEQPAASLWKLTKASAKPRAAVRYRMPDAPVTRASGWGVPVPVVRCESCGTQAVPAEQLPVQAPEEPGASLGCECPGCGGPAQRDGGTIDPRFDRMWTWLSICVPGEDRAASMLGHSDHARWLPARQVVDATEAGTRLLDQRALAKMLHEVERLPETAREPSAGAVLCGPVGAGNGAAGGGSGELADPAELLDRLGADVVRLAVLNAAAPVTAFAWDGQPLRRSQRFLAELWSYGEPRLREWPVPDEGIDGSTPWRRRLAKWCRVGADKVATGIERLETQRATHNAILLLERIEDFESRAATDGVLDEQDREAVVAALLVLLRVLNPFAPHITEELWSIAGHDTLLANTPWPEIS